jgi:hypothetical protein
MDPNGKGDLDLPFKGDSEDMTTVGFGPVTMSCKKKWM